MYVICSFNKNCVAVKSALDKTVLDDRQGVSVLKSQTFIPSEIIEDM